MKEPGDNDELRGLLWLFGLLAVALCALVLVQALGGSDEITQSPRARREVQARVEAWLGVTDRPERPREPAPAPRLGLGTHATSIAEENDPQMLAFRRSYRSEVDAGISQPFSVRYHRGRLVSASGAAGVTPGASCEVRVLPVESFGFNCLVRVMCEGVVVYPDAALGAGYAPCEVEAGQAVSAVDESSFDGDREINFNARAGRVSVQESDAESRPLMSVQIQLES